MKQHLIRIERIAGELNAWLLVIAIGLWPGQISVGDLGSELQRR